MAREMIAVRLVAKVNRPLAYAAMVLMFVADWVLSRAVKVETHGA